MHKAQARPPLPQPGLTGANWEMVVAGRTLLTVVSVEVGPAVAAARALLTVLCVLWVAAASLEKPQISEGPSFIAPLKANMS